MKSLVSWFASNSVAANLLMLLLLIGGSATVLSVRMEVFPEFSLDAVTVRVLYPGSVPSEVEESICVKIEEEVHALEGVKRVRSSAREGVGSVTIEVRKGYDARELMDDIKTRVDAIATFPEQAERPIYQELTYRKQVIEVAIHGQADERSLKHVAERVRDELSALDSISQVELASARPYEISIEVSEEALQRHGLSFDEIAQAVRRSSLDLSGGAIKTDGGEILLRTMGQAYVGAEFERIPLLTAADGTRVSVGDVATVIDGFEDSDQSSNFNGEPAVLVQVFRTGDESAIEISEAVRAYALRARASLPAGISLSPWQDQSLILADRLQLLLSNGAQGLALVFLVLALFLRFRLALWIVVGIPISFLGALWVLPTVGGSINMLSLFGFILVLGIVVDDAIIVGESIHTEQSRGSPGLAGAKRGVQRVSVPVVFAVLTSVAAFVPLLMLPGTMGKFFRQIPLPVIPALAFSLIESQLILPAHLAHEGALGTRIAQLPPFSWWVRGQGFMARGLELFSERVYLPLLDLALRFRYATIAVALSSLLLTLGTLLGSHVRFIFFPPIEGDVLAAWLTMPEGTPSEATSRAVAQMERAVDELLREQDPGWEPGQPHPLLRNELSSVGEMPYRQSQVGPGAGKNFRGSHYAEIALELIPAQDREVTATVLVKRWRELCGPVAGAVELRFMSNVMNSGDPIDVQLAGPDLLVLGAAAESLKRSIALYDGAFDISDSFRSGKPEVQLDLMPEAERLGLARVDLARQVRQGFFGEEVQRIQRGRDELKVMVRYPADDRRSLHQLESMRVRTPRGAEVPFGTVARARLASSASTISRTDRMRTVNVIADVDLSVAAPGDILRKLESEVLPALLVEHPGVSYSLEGQNREQGETIAAMRKYFLMAMIAVFALMAIPFRSYVQPLIVMAVIPFGLVGAVVGHWFMEHDMSVLSMCGLVALAGVVVNDSLVLVDRVNQRRNEGASVLDAVRGAGVSRFRPIFLTSLTTFMGLLPLMLEKSVQAQFLVPMAISLAFGVVFATLLTLVLVPALYLVLQDLKRFPRWLFGARAVAQESEPVGAKLPAS